MKPDICTIGKDDKIPVVVEPEGPPKDRACPRVKVFRCVSVGAIIALTVTVISLAVFGILYIQDLREQLQDYDDQTRDQIPPPNPTMGIEAMQVLLETKELLGLEGMSGKPFPIYRKDLACQHVAYWEIQFNKTEYIIISAGKKTGDRKLVTHGPLPSLTSTLNQLAIDNDQRCAQHFMMTPTTDLMCQGDNGRIVATTIDGDIDTNGTDVDPHEYVEQNLARLESDWVKHAYEIHNSGEWADEEFPDDKELSPNSTDGEQSFGEQSIYPGEIMNVAVGKIETLRQLGIRYRAHSENQSETQIQESQIKLCMCSGICDEDDIFSVNTALLKVDGDTGLGYFRFEISKNARELFNDSDVSFTIEINHSDGTYIRKRYGIEYDAPRKRRSTQYYVIPYTNYLPSYSTFYYGGCAVHDVSLYWAEVFGYYDRRSHYVSSRYGRGSQPLYRSGSDGLTGSNSQVAPSYRSDTRITGYIKYFNRILNTYCSRGYPYMSTSYIANVLPFFRYRQSGSPRIIKSSSMTTARSYIRSGWPVIIVIRNGISHYAVLATRYKAVYSYRYRYCYRVRYWFRYITRCTPWYYRYNYYMYAQYGNFGHRWIDMSAGVLAVIAPY